MDYIEVMDPVDMSSMRMEGANALVPVNNGAGQNALAARESESGGTVNAFGTVITAQRVQVPRNPQKILQDLKALCAMAGPAYVYAWTVNNKQTGKKDPVEGPTIKLANDLARTYGNCGVAVKVEELPTATIFHATFADFETGYMLSRPFRQRKKQNIGQKYDSDRAADMVFQIGVSKAIRNVVTNALQTYSDFMVDEAKNGLFKKVENDRAKFEAFVEKVADRHDIDMVRVEATVGRKFKDWTVRDLARVAQEMRGIHEGLSDPDEIYPEKGSGEPEAMTPKTDAGDAAPAGDGKPKGRTGRGRPAAESAAAAAAAAPAADAKPAETAAPTAEAAKPAETAAPAAEDESGDGEDGEEPSLFQAE